ncbi:MAG: hypothetical protein IKL33_02530, partial [Alphaproteobacteria bacterium]|nr:hypothetical protein [Alphaproteobacteria bacterium]
IQALFLFAEKTPETKQASAKLDEITELKIEAMIIDNDYVDIYDLPYAQHLVDNLQNEEQKAQAQEKLNKVLENYKEENGLNASAEVMRKNDASLDEELNNISLYGDDNSVSEDFDDLKNLVANIEIKDDENDTETVLDEEKTKQHINILFEAAKLEAYQESVGSLKYLMASKKEQKEQLVSKIKDHFVAKIGLSGIASTFEAPTDEEQQDENKFKAYIERREKAAENFIKELVDGGKKVVLKVKDIISACAETDINVSKFNDILKSAMGRKSKLNKRLNKFRNAAVGLWGKRYEIARGIVKNIKENKWQHITNTAATLAVGLTTVYASGAAAAAIGAYAVCSAAGNYVWPVISEAQKMREKAKENNQKLSFWQSIKDAYKVKKDDAEYKRKGRWGLVGGAVGAMFGFGATSFGLETIAARAGATLARTISTSTAQFTSLLAAKRDFKKDPSDSNRSKLRSARISFGVGATISGIFSFLSINRMSNHSEAVADAITNTNSEASAVENKWNLNWLFNKEDTNSESDIRVPYAPNEDGIPSQVNVEDSISVKDTTTVAPTETEKPKWNLNWLFNKEDTNSESDIRVPYAPEEATGDLSSVDASVADNASTETTVSEASVAEEVSQTSKVGDVLLRKEHQNGIVETQVMGENGNVYQQVEGLKGGTKTSVSVQTFYERRIKNMNQYNHLVEVMANEEGSPMTANEAVALMEKQIDAGFVTLPDGVTKAHAIHTAFMHAHYRGDMSAIMALSCPNGEDTETMFAQLVHRYSTDNGFIGRPTDPEYRAIMKAGTVIINEPCEV